VKALTQPALDRTLATWAWKRYRVHLYLTVPSALTIELSDLIIGWGNLVEAVNTVDVDGEPATVDIVLTNTRPVGDKSSLPALMRSLQNTSGAYEFAEARVTVRQRDEGLGDLDEVPLGEFFIEEALDITAERLTLRMSSKDLLIEDKSALETITTDSMPLADPDVNGKVVPVIIGQVPNVLALPIVAGGRTSLVVAITATAPGVGAQLRLSDVTKFPASGILQVDEEKIQYRDRVTTLDNEGRVTVVKRGYLGTAANAGLAAPHAAGAEVAEIRSGPKAYRYAVGMNLGDNGAGGSKHRNKLVKKIMVHGALQPQATIDYDEEFPPRSGKRYTIINFPALPILKRQVALKIDDGLTVGDNIAVSSPSVTQVKRVATNLPRSNDSTGTGPLSVSLTATLPAAPAGIRDVVRTVSGFVSIGRSEFVDISVGGVRHRLADGGFNGSFSFTYGTGTRYGDETVFVSAKVPTGVGSGPDRLSVTLNSYTADVEVAVQINKTGSASRSGSIGLTGNSTADIVIGGDVTCDVEGIKDDAAGTISGTPNQLLTNPADVTKLAALVIYPHSTTADIGSSFATTRAALKAAGYRWDFLLRERSFAALRRKFGEQAACALHLESGRWEYPRLRFGTATTFYATEFRPTSVAPLVALQLATGGFTAAASSVGPAIWTLDYGTKWWDGEPVVVSRTPRTETWTRLRVFFARAWNTEGEEAYTVVRTYGDLGPKAREKKLELDFIRHAGTASTVANFWLKHWSRQRWRIRGVAFWNALALEKFDVVDVPNHPVLLAHAGVVFRVHKKIYRLADDNPARIELEGIEANP
jgi:hypothetical protein